MSTATPPGSNGAPGPIHAGGGGTGPVGLGGGGSGDSGGEPDGLPWENRQQLGFVAAIVGTAKGVLMEPASSFREMRKSGGLGEPLLYAVLLGWVGGVFGLIWQTLMSAVVPLLDTGKGLEDLLEGAVGVAVLAVLMPALVALGQFIGAAIVHLFALMFGAGEKGFEVTFRVMAYASGSTAILNVVPIFGSMAASIWSIVATIIGLTEAQETTGGRAAAAVLVPIVLCCCCVIGGAVAFGVAAGLADSL